MDLIAEWVVALLCAWGISLVLSHYLLVGQCISFRRSYQKLIKKPYQHTNDLVYVLTGTW